MTEDTTTETATDAAPDSAAEVVSGGASDAGAQLASEAEQGASEAGQLALVRGQVRPTRATPGREPAPELPVARVVVDLPLAHLDRPFDYLVPARMHDACVPGCRVRIRFAGQDLDGFVLDRVAESEHTGRLAPLRRVVSSEPVLAPEVARLARLVADRYAGTLADVLRLAVPPRHARVEREEAARSDAPEEVAPEEVAPELSTGPWQPYVSGRAFLDALRGGAAPRAVWTALPGEDWPTCLAGVAAATLAGGRGVLLVVPDHRDAARLDAACVAALGPGRHVLLTAELGPAERYRRFLAVSRGRVRCVVGTRAAAFAPVHHLGLVGCWDDGDDLHAEPRAPYPHVREVLLLRAHESGCAAVVGGFGCTAEGAQLLATGWARPLAGSRATVRARSPRIHVAGEGDAELARDPAARAVRLPHRAFEIARTALATGPVLVQVPRAGYRPTLACQRCRRPARCDACSGPLHQGGSHAVPSCGWCGRPAAFWRCPECGGTGLRAPVVGARRTAEELGRAFPRVAVRTSGGDRVLDQIGSEPALVVATPGAEPVASGGGYAAALLLDTWLALARADLRTGEEALRRWLNAATLVRPADDGGTVVVIGDPSVPAIQALIRWHPVDQAERELAERAGAGFPPAVRLATLEGGRRAVAELAEAAAFPDAAERLGPVPLERPESADRRARLDGDDEIVRLVVRAPRRDGTRLAAALKSAQGVRSARKAAGTVRVQLDPAVLG